ncbi:hypothetical protein N7478_010556 [Penicillium angulare]|uniref:uncharacterized protein n=1 Tax=Penicillium angulare TaxID=116970 RepID=UPI0025407CD2|nr:uncharacterized protein N7478_010556 [Penicillium angulare]KAJ5267748.1 hypothetical protein N7478_010556 [Penicillium angulare]
MSREDPMISSGAGMSRFVSYDPIISFECEPPSRVWQGNPFTIIVKVTFPGSEEMLQTDASFGLNISLSDDHGQEFWKELRGSLTSSLETVIGRGCQRIAVFKDIIIHGVGRRKLRILLAVASMSQITVKARLDSNFFEVQAA